MDKRSFARSPFILLSLLLLTVTLKVVKLLFGLAGGGGYCLAVSELSSAVII